MMCSYNTVWTKQRIQDSSYILKNKNYKIGEKKVNTPLSGLLQ